MDDAERDALQAPTTGDARVERRFVAVGTALFAAVVCAGLWRHELWRDEAKAWLIARDSTSLVDVYYNRRYEGHPVLWYWMLYLGSRLSRDPVVMQIIHAITATAGAFVFLRFAPFGRWVRGLFVAGVFPLYTYAIISRNYAVGTLLLFALLALFASPRRRPICVAILVALLASCSIYGLFLAAAFASAWGLRDVIAPIPASWGRRAIAATIVLVGLAFGAVQVVPPAPTAVPDRARLAAFSDFSVRGVGVRESLSRLWSPILPVPPTDRVVNLLRVGASARQSLNVGVPSIVRTIAAIAALAPVVYALRRAPVAIAFLAVALGAMIGFEATLYNATARHQGHAFLAILAAAWIWQSTTGRPLAASARLGMLAVLSLHAFVGVGYVVADLVQPYSSSLATARLLAARYGRDFDLIFEPADYGSSVSAYLDVPVYFPTHRKWGTYELRDGTPKVAMPAELRDAIELVLGHATRPVVLVIDGPQPKIPGVAFERIASRQQSIFREGWDVYEVRRAAPSTTPSPKSDR